MLVCVCVCRPKTQDLSNNELSSLSYRHSIAPQFVPILYIYTEYRPFLYGQFIFVLSVRFRKLFTIAAGAICRVICRSTLQYSQMRLPWDECVGPRAGLSAYQCPENIHADGRPLHCLSYFRLDVCVFVFLYRPIQYTIHIHTYLHIYTYIHIYTQLQKDSYSLFFSPYNI